MQKAIDKLTRLLEHWLIQLRMLKVSKGSVSNFDLAEYHKTVGRVEALNDAISVLESV